MKRVCLLVCLLACVVAEQIDLVLNNGSVIVSDIKRIYHDPQLRQVGIDLQVKRHCDLPSFVVRLSGSSLYKLDQDKSKEMNDESRIDSVRFSYPPLLSGGVHFIEVVVLYCNRFNPRTFRKYCVEKPTSGGATTVTMPYSFVATPAPHGATIATPPPRWILPRKNSSLFTPVLLPTRYQGGGAAEDLTLHHQYEIIDLPPLQDKLHSVLEMSRAGPRPLINVCLVGCSHARSIAGEGYRLNARLNNTLHFTSIWNTYPHQFSLQSVIDAECSYAILGYGQWPFSFRANFTAESYTNDTNQLLHDISSYTGPVQFFVRSMNYNPLSGRIICCWANDYRTPPVVDMANRIMKSVASKHNVEFIDTNFIMGPLWDSARDWNHPPDKILLAEAHWIMHSVLESSLKHQRPVQFDSMPKLAENDVVRFTSATTVYLYRNDTLRAFPNGATFMKMGFEFGNVKAFMEKKMRHFHIAEELPSL